MIAASERFAYLRVSSEEQARRETSATQRSGIQCLCDEKKVQLPPEQIYADEGISGTVLFSKRPQSSALLERVRRGLVRELLVYKLDRLGRDYVDTMVTLAELMKLGVKVISVKEGPVEDTAQGRLKSGIQSLFNAYEREQIIERSVDGSRRKAREGFWLGGVTPYGYRKGGEDRKVKLVPATEPIPGIKLSEVDVVRRIYALTAEGKSCKFIQDYLNGIGVPPPPLWRKRKKPPLWCRGTIRNIIKSTTHMGFHKWGKHKAVPDENGKKHLKANPPDNWIIRPCEAIVGEELWKSANAALPKNQIAAMAHVKNQYLLRGLISCASCGRTYFGQCATQPNGKRQLHYRCLGRYDAHGEKCKAQSVNGYALEELVWNDHIERYLAQPGLALKQLERKMVANDGQDHRVRDKIAELEESLEQHVAARKIALRQLTRQRITEKEYDAELRSINDETAVIERRLTELRKVSADMETKVHNINKARLLLEELRVKANGNLTFEKKRRIVEALVAGITVGPLVDSKLNVKVVFRFEPHFERYEKEMRPDLAPDYMPNSVSLLSRPAAFSPPGRPFAMHYLRL
jgi:site-specific DNA recombinase